MSNARMPVSLRPSFDAPRRVPLLAVPLAAALVAVVPAHAADAVDAAADEIVVTGTRQGNNPFADPAAPFKVDRSASSKLTEDVVDTPKSITIIPKEVIEALGALSFRDLARTQPGVTLGTGEGGNAFGDRIFIRGFDARNDVYVDGLRDPGVGSREVFALEQVEIVKGPSSTYGGRGTTGGSVNLVSKAPQKDDFFVGEVTGGSDEARRFTGDLNRKLSDTVELRVNGMFTDGDVAGRGYTHNTRWGVAGSLAWQPTAAVSLIADYYHLTADGLPDWGVPFDPRTQQPFAVPRTTFYGIVRRDFTHGVMDIGTVRGEWRPTAGLKLTTRTRYGNSLNSYIATVPEAPNLTDPNPANWTVRANPQTRNARTETWANATEATGEFDTGRFHHSVVAGVEFDHEDIVNRPFAFASSENFGANVVAGPIILQRIFAPDPYNPAYTLFRSLSGARQETLTTTKAAYLLDTIDLTPKIKLSGGVRFDDYIVSYDSLTALPTSAAQTRSVLRNHSSFVNWNAGLTYKPVERGTVYFAASSSSNPSGEQSDSAGVSYGGLGPTTVNLDPERNYSYEVGAKYEAGPGGHLLLTAALFRTDKTNGRVTNPLSGTSQVLAGQQRVEGVELDASGNLTPRWAVFGGYTYLDARVLPTTNPTVAGGQFPNVAEHSFALLSTYRVFDRVTVGGQANYNSAKFGGTTTALSSTLPGYWRFDLTAKASITSKVELQVNILNLTDKVYYDAIYRSATPFSYIAPGRSALATLRFKI